MKNVSFFFVIMALLCLLEPVAAMSIDQNCTLVIEFHDGRAPMNLPTDEIRSITFRPTFSGTTNTTNPTITPAKPVEIQAVLRGTWSGKYTNTRNEPGTDELTLVETNGKVDGTHAGLKILEGKRSGDTMTWKMERGGGFAQGGCTWNVQAAIQENGNLLIVKYTGQDHRTDKNDGGRYSGEAQMRKIR